MIQLRRLIGEERGFALVIALAVTVVFSMTVITVIESATSNQRNATMSGGRVSAYNLAEAGVSNAMSILRVPTNNALDKYVFCPDSASLPPLPCTRTDTYSGGTVTWYATLYQNAALGTAYWDLFSTGHVRNPHGGADYKKTIRRRSGRPHQYTAAQQPLVELRLLSRHGHGSGFQRLRHDDSADRRGALAALRLGQSLHAEQGEGPVGPADRKGVGGSPAKLQSDRSSRS